MSLSIIISINFFSISSELQPRSRPVLTNYVSHETVCQKQKAYRIWHLTTNKKAGLQKLEIKKERKLKANTVVYTNVQSRTSSTSLNISVRISQYLESKKYMTNSDVHKAWLSETDTKTETLDSETEAFAHLSEMRLWSRP